MRELTIDSKLTKTYKTKENLDKALDKYFGAKGMALPASVTYLVVEVEGRYTAVFTNLTRDPNGMYLSYVAHAGFKVVG